MADYYLVSKIKKKIELSKHYFKCDDDQCFKTIFGNQMIHTWLSNGLTLQFTIKIKNMAAVEI